ncbi:bacteriocin fulvocin C-related protein [Lutibacter sp.]|uniref:bacteriocin fulvocin C-related protein n=1 Tax=Lutibacter sp. TaxID=1925666 RepID=UPI0025C3D97A|nr:bacteriocin fulvocin C-related protein [Lutibacter sp.]MCF6167348.1 bacteriocin fulvocin C-related protein [Lutibacter sp.]
MNRSELAILSSGKQRAAFRTFTPQKRKQLWLDKFKQIKSLNFSKKEVNHLKIMEEFLKKYDFSKELTKKQEEYLTSWFEEGKLNFKWTPYFLISGFAKLNEDAVLSKKEFKSKFPEVSMRDDLTTPPDEGGGDIDYCDCRWDITCQLAGLGDCSNTSCEGTTFGCGWLGMQSCTSDCSSLY